MTTRLSTRSFSQTQSKLELTGQGSNCIWLTCGLQRSATKQLGPISFSGSVSFPAGWEPLQEKLPANSTARLVCVCKGNAVLLTTTAWSACPTKTLAVHVRVWWLLHTFLTPVHSVASRRLGGEEEQSSVMASGPVWLIQNHVLSINKSRGEACPVKTYRQSPLYTSWSPL